MKKILLMLALMLPCLGAWAQIQTSTRIDAPENLYKIKSKNNLYMAAHSNPTQTNYGRFAFYAVEGKENTYKIYSYDANLWLTYTKASGYNNGMNFVSFAQTQENANEWSVASVGEYYQVAPYNNTGVASKYWNFFGGINSTYYSYDDYKNTLGLYEKGAGSDGGSAWVFEAVDGSDYAAPTTLNYEITDDNGNVYNGTYTGVAGRTRIFTSQNTLCPITNVTFEGNTYKANIAIPFHTSGVVISSFNGNEIRFAVKEGKEIATKTVPTAETINNYLWNIHPSFANNTLTFSIEHVATSKFLYTTATARAHNDATITLEDEGTQFVYAANNGFKYGNLWLSTNSSTTSEQCLGMWDSQHNGAKHLIHKVNNYTITDAAGNVYEGEFNGYDLKDEEFLPTFTGAHGYTLNNGSWTGYDYSANIDFKIPVSSASRKNQVTIHPFDGIKYYVSEGIDVKATKSSAQDNDLWEIYPSLLNGEFAFQIKNVATDKFISTSLTSNQNSAAKGHVIVTESKGTDFTLESEKQFKVKGTSPSVYLSTYTSTYADQYATINTSHGGTKNTFNTVKEPVTYILTDNAGNTYTADVTGTIGVDPVFTGIPVVTLPYDPTKKLDGYLLENGSWTGNTYTATITFPFIVSSASQSNPMLIRQHFNVDNKLWTAVGEKVNAVDGIPSLGASQWMIYPSLNGTEFTFKIKSVSTEKYVTATIGGITLTTDGTNFKCGRTDANGKSAFVWTCTNGDETLYVTLGSDEDNTPLDVTTDVATAGENAFVAFQDFIDFKVTIGEAGYTTVYAPFTVMMPYEQNMGKTVDIYAITDGKVVNDKVQLTQMSWYIPGGQAAILNGKPGTYVFATNGYDLDAETDAVWEQNLLKGSSVNTYVEGEAFVLSAPGDKENIGMYKAELNMNEEGVKVGKETGTHFLNNAGKAYLPASLVETTAGALRFNFGGTTAIESVLNNGVDANAPIYDLSGRRVMNAVKGGIYIQNGKKFIVK